MATSRPASVAEPLSTESSTMLPYSANPDINSLLHELLARDRDAQLFPALRDAGPKRRLPPLLQELLAKMDRYLDVTDPNPRLFCKGFREAYSIFATDAGRKRFFGQDPPPDGMHTKPTYATPFVASVKLMQSIDALPVDGFPIPLRWSSVGLFHTMYCLFYIFDLNAGTPVEHHPALILWLKSMLRLEMLRDARISAPKYNHAAAETQVRFGKEIDYLITRFVALNLGLCPPREGILNRSNRPFRSPDEFLRDADGLVYPKDTTFITSQAGHFLDILDSQGILSQGRQLTGVDYELVQEMFARVRAESSKSNGDSKLQNGRTIITAESTSVKSPAHPHDSTKSGPALQITPTNIDDVLPRMDRSDAHQLLVNLPLDIQSMETLNAVFARLQQHLSSSKQPDTEPLAPLNLDPTIIACGYIQHGLRQLERQRPAASRAAAAAAPGLHDFVVVPSGGASSSYAGSAPTAAGTTTSSSSTSTATTTSTAAENSAAQMDSIVAAAEAADDMDQEEYAPADDAADTKRKITLLLLFMRNLIKKNIVGWPALQYDIQEICTRYSPFREVRAFRRWIETGEEV